MNPFTLTLIPFTYGAWDEGSGHLSAIYHDVVFTADFGLILKGESFNALHVDFQEGTLHHVGKNGEVQEKIMFFTAIPR